MFWLALTTAFVVVFGGLLYVLPSKAQRRIGQMRLDARKKNLTIYSQVVPDVNATAVERVTAGGKLKNPTKQCVAWARQYADEYSAVPVWRVFVAPESTKPMPGYVANPPLDEAQRDLGEEYWIGVGKVLEKLPQQLVAVECAKSQVAWIGQERVADEPDGFIDQIQLALDELISLNIEASRSRKDYRED